jgi:endonuclease/exonuclease/phosphatase family metal-dependent hydrolase
VSLRVMTYNIRHGRGRDGRVDLARITEVIRSYGPDVVGIQEVDVNKPRSGLVHQAAELAERLGMTMAFGPCIDADGERYGIATLSRLPIRDSRLISLPVRDRSEPRCALMTRLTWEGTVEIVNTHLSTVFRERGAQCELLSCSLGADHTIIIGDFNCTPWSPAYKTLSYGFRSATRFARTWPATLPIVPIDHILVRGLEVVTAGTWTHRPARVASDHLPVVAELRA